jgi:KaiC/GvpD/RAD55 family RecA-like ATPase
MVHLKELSERSPLRVFERSIRGGLGPGNIGVVVARHGVGKSAFLVGVAIDNLMRGKNVLHVALGQSLGRVREYYDEIFFDLARTWRLDDMDAVKRTMERHRHIHAYIGGTFSMAKLRDEVSLLREFVHFSPNALVVDGWSFEGASVEDLRELHALAKEFDAELWMSAVCHRESQKNDRGVPEPLAQLESELDVIVRLAHDGKNVHVSLLKDHDNPRPSDARLALDPVTMLLIEEHYVDLDPSFSR